MSVELNHTIVHSLNDLESAKFLAGLLDLEVGDRMGPFIPVTTANGVTLDYATVPAEDITTQHYAFLVSEDVFDKAHARIKEAGLTYYADPHRTRVNEINHNHGGRGLYFEDPSGHYMEILTSPYGTPAAS
ncbi:VOC family protein [Streptomyces sp. NPDC048718]|uniref:VOC family protein n=1 Tax=Streptomyces sp. NPDC048718 TaxID=3365587 RepID=UPI00371C6AD9